MKRKKKERKMQHLFLYPEKIKVKENLDKKSISYFIFFRREITITNDNDPIQELKK